MKEYDIQKHIWDNRDNWKNLIVDFKFPEKYDFDNQDNDISMFFLTPDKLIFNELIDRLHETYENLKELNIFGCEVPLKKDGDSTIRADLLGIIAGVSGIALIEIKKSAQTERQAFTELLAYAGHLHSIFPTISKDDITYILISPMKERIVREATIHSFLFDEKPVFAFIPSWINDDVTTLKLTPWIPNKSDIVHVTESIFAQKNFEVVKVAWDKIEDWNAEKGKYPSKEMVARMNKISSYAAQIMESKGVHGFVYTSQMFPEIPLLQNSLIIAGINPFKVAINNYKINNGIKSTENAINLLDIIPELANKSMEIKEAQYFLESLIMTWENTITKIAFDCVDVMIMNDSNVNIEKSFSGFNWEEYQTLMLEDAVVFNYEIRATGLMRKLFIAYTKEDYSYLAKYGYESHPFLDHGDIPTFAVDYLNKHTYFRDFLLRLFDPFYNLRDSVADILEEDTP